MTCWFASVTSRICALFVIATVVGADPVPADMIRRNVVVARILAEKAWQSLENGQIVRSYLLYTEAAKRDPNTPLYRQETNVLASTAKLLMKNKLETASIQSDIQSAESQEQPIAPAALATQSSFAMRPDSSHKANSTPPAVVPNSPVKADMVAPVEIAAVIPVAKADIAPTPIVVSPNVAAKPLESPAVQPQSSGQPIAESNAPLDKPDPLRFTYGAQILAYGTYNSVRYASPFNPDNQLAELPKEDFHADLRPDFKLGNTKFSISAKPRADYEHSLSVSSHNADYYLQEWSARLQVTSSLNISYGREVPLWGPSMSVPASNPFFRDNGRNTPLIEIGARDFGRIVWQPKSNFSISYIANTALRRGTPDFLPFKPIAGVKADYTGRNFLLSGIYTNNISSPFGTRKFLGGYSQVTIGQSVRLYVEGSAQQGNPGYFALPAGSPYGIGYAQTKLGDGLTPRTIVGGIAYTDSRAGTWTGEYIYNPFGYTSMFATNFFQTADQLAGTYSTGGLNARLAAEELALTSNPGIGPLRRNYAFGQYQRNGLGGHFDVVFRYTLNAEDRSGQGVAYFVWNTSDHLQVVAVVAGMNGSVDTEFARYLRYQAQLGFRIFLH